MQDMESALAVLRRAIQNEIAGQRFYDDAAYFCIDLWAKEIFATLAREEERHTRLLLLEYRALKEGGRWIEPQQALASDEDVDITQFAFPYEGSGVDLFPPGWSAGDVIDRRADDLAALAFGVQMEEQAIALYSAEAAGVADPIAREAYAFLAEDEVRHYQQLKKQWEKLAGMPFPEE